MKVGDKVYITSAACNRCYTDIIEMVSRIHTIESISECGLIRLSGVEMAFIEVDLVLVEEDSPEADKLAYQDLKRRGRIVPANNFLSTVAGNVDNEKLSDREFRAFVRRTLPIVNYTLKCVDCGRLGKERWVRERDATRCDECFNTAMKDEVTQ